jgi:hypothetical protein
MQVRSAPDSLVRRLREFPDFLDVRFNESLSRWEFQFSSAAGLPTSQFFGWDRNPLTGAVIEPDEFGLLPFRDLDDVACAEIIASCERTFIGNRADGAGTWKKQSDQTLAYNAGVRRRSAVKRADDYAYAVQQVDLRRPWLKHHHRAGSGKIILS